MVSKTFSMHGARKSADYLRESWYGDETCQVPHARTFGVEADQSVVLALIPLPEGSQSLIIASCDGVQSPQHVGDELVDTVTLLY